MAFVESNKVEQMILYTVAKLDDGVPLLLSEDCAGYSEIRPAGWGYLPHVSSPRQPSRPSYKDGESYSMKEVP